VFTVLALASTTPAWAAAQPTTSAAEAPGHMLASRKGKSDAGIRGHGFVADHGVFTTIDVSGGFPDSLIFDINNRGQIVGYFFDAGVCAKAF